VSTEVTGTNTEVNRVLQNPSHVIMSDSLNNILSEESINGLQEDINFPTNFSSELVFDQNFRMHVACSQFSKNNNAISLTVFVPSNQLTNFFNSKFINVVKIYENDNCVFVHEIKDFITFNFCANFSDDNHHCEIELSF